MEDFPLRTPPREVARIGGVYPEPGEGTRGPSGYAYVYRDIEHQASLPRVALFVGLNPDRIMI